MKFIKPVALVAPRRTPIGKLGGALAEVEPHLLLAHALRGVHDSLPVPAREALAEVLVGCVRNGVGNMARVGALEAGVAQDVPAVTIDRQCASSMEAVAQAAMRVTLEPGAVVLVGGVESASQAPWLFQKASRPFAYQEPRAFRVRMSSESAGDPPMGETAEILADEFGITRGAMDEFALESHRKAAGATEAGAFAAELLPYPVAGRKGPILVDRDECVRGDSTEAALAKLPPVFRRDGRVTAGNSSPLNDAAAGAVVASAEACERHGLEPLAWIEGVCAVGLDPVRMGLGPALAIPRLLAECGRTTGEVDLFEINEAFAAQVLAVLEHLRRGGNALPGEKLNVRGGAIALGHPLGATGLRLLVTLAHALRDTGCRTGVASLCVGGGQGMAVLLRRA